MEKKTHAIARKEDHNNKSGNEEETLKLNTVQRTVSLATGAFMLIKAIRNRSLLRGIGAGYLLYRGATGTCPASEFIGHDIMDLNPIRA